MEMRDDASGHYKLRDHVQEKNRGYWPTPTTPQPHDNEQTVGKYMPSQNQFDLTAAVIKWPTPAQRDWRCGLSNDAPRDQLNEMVAAMYPTARAEDSQCAGGHRGNDDTLYGKICKPADGPENPGSLNPTWVEWLMGWPINWTALDPLPEAITLGWETDPADRGEIPRVATGVNDRVARLKALGNGQVPACVEAAWKILTRRSA